MVKRGGKMDPAFMKEDRVQRAIMVRKKFEGRRKYRNTGTTA